MSTPLGERSESARTNSASWIASRKTNFLLLLVVICLMLLCASFFFDGDMDSDQVTSFSQKRTALSNSNGVDFSKFNFSALFKQQTVVEPFISLQETVLVGNDSKKLVWDPIYHIYRLDGKKPIIWAFWDKNDIPPVIQLSLATIMCHNMDDFHVQIVHDSDIDLWLDHIHPAFKYLTGNHKADYFRARILDAFGGIYVDADTIGLGNLWHLFEKLVNYDLINISWRPDGDAVAVGILGPMRSRSVFTGKWVTEIHQILDQKLGELESRKYTIGWGQICREVVKKSAESLIKNSSFFTYFALSGQRTWGQLVMAGPGAEGNLSAMTAPHKYDSTELLMFMQSGMKKELKQMSVVDILKSEYVLAELYRLSFKACRKKQAENEGRSASQRHRLKHSGFVVIEPRKEIKESDDFYEWVLQFVKKNISP